LSALDALPLYPHKFRIKSLIFILDGEHIKKNSLIEIKNYLKTLGVNIYEIESLQGAIQMKCKSGPYEILLYCIILGPEVFIEEEVAKLIELKLRITIDLSNKRESAGRKSIKNQIKKVLREKKTSLEKIIMESGIKTLETTFPNICTVLKKIEQEQKKS